MTEILTIMLCALMVTINIFYTRLINQAHYQQVPGWYVTLEMRNGGFFVNTLVTNNDKDARKKGWEPIYVLRTK